MWLQQLGDCFSTDARQCRERGMNYINPVLDRTPLSPAEEHLLNEKFTELGS
jgi:hypothetical protein